MKTAPVSKKLNGPWSALLKEAYKKDIRKAHKCEACGKACGNLGALQTHVKTHPKFSAQSPPIKFTT